MSISFKKFLTNSFLLLLWIYKYSLTSILYASTTCNHYRYYNSLLERFCQLQEKQELTNLSRNREIFYIYNLRTMQYSLDIKRHGLAHVMAQAVQENFPGVKIATGPYTEDGFYYDFDFGEQEFSDKDFKTIEKSMKKIISQNQDFVVFEVSYDEARLILEQM